MERPGIGPEAKRASRNKALLGFASAFLALSFFELDRSWRPSALNAFAGRMLGWTRVLDPRFDPVEQRFSWDLESPPRQVRYRVVLLDERTLAIRRRSPFLSLPSWQLGEEDRRVLEATEEGSCLWQVRAFDERGTTIARSPFARFEGTSR